MKRRTKLITPALRRDLLEKAAQSGADVIHIELEDGVAPNQKDAARDAALRALQEIDWNGREVWVRINPPTSIEARDDIEVLAAGAPHALLLPKVSGPEDVIAISGLLAEAERANGLGERQIMIAAVIERITGLSRVEEIASADPRMTALVLGTEDMSVEYGYRLDRTGESFETLYLKSRCILAARVAGIDCLDAAHSYYRDVAGTRRAAEWAAKLGFSGKTCLSPVQVAPVNDAFAPTDEEIQWACKVLDALDEAASNDLAVAVSQGMMVDAPHAVQARRILELADRRKVERSV
jgi:citrate lyase subunit beta / citryl-CoA lyase